MEWTGNLRKAVQYIEEHLLDDIDAEDVAKAVYMSPFYFQKGFHIMTGYSIAEYIRYRRLYLAALEALSGDKKIIDLAYRYGYQTPESFTKAFSRFHGVSPMQIKNSTGSIKVFLPLKITISIQGGNDMNVTIEKMDSMMVIGWEKEINLDNSYHEIPAFWSEFCAQCRAGTADPAAVRAMEDNCIGEFGICIDDMPGTNRLHYMIAGKYRGGGVPEGMKLFELPALQWAKFSCCGPLPGALQSVNTKIYREWLPNNPDYEISAGINVEYYTMGDTAAPDYESEIWIPVK